MPGILFFKNVSGKSYKDIEDISAIGEIRILAFMQEDLNKIDKLMKSQRTNSAFASYDAEADAPACKRANFF